MSDPEFIVGEVSKNWLRTYGGGMRRAQLVSQLFEKMIETNRGRGYVLHSFTLHRLMVSPQEMNETIIAVFRREPGGVPATAPDYTPELRGVPCCRRCLAGIDAGPYRREVANTVPGRQLEGGAWLCRNCDQEQAE